MAESHPVYVSCAVGNNAFADVQVQRYGSLVELALLPGIPQAAAHLTPDHARQVIAAMEAVLEEIEAPNG